MAFHSKKPNVKVYHDTEKCTEGNNIEKRNLVGGTGGKKLCGHCKRIKK